MRVSYRRRKKDKKCVRCGARPLYEQTVLCSDCRDLACAYFRRYNKTKKRRAYIRSKARAYWHTEKYLKKRRAYLRSCWKNPVLHSKLLKRTRSKMREYRKTAAWKAYILTYNQAYRKTLKGRASNKAHFHNRKAGRSGNGTWSPTQFLTLCRKQNWRCACCLRRRRLTADHVHPISKGGRNIIGNIQALCGPCNFSKSSKTGAYTCSACGRHHRKATQRMRFDR